MLIDPALQEHYLAKDWVVVDGVFLREEMEKIIELSMSVSQDLARAGETSDFDATEDGSEASPRKTNLPFLREPGFRPFVLDPRLTEIVQAFLRKPPLLFRNHLFMRRPRIGSEKPFHQDNFYFRLEPADHVITAWIALDDVDEGNACLRYIDGSHQGPLLPGRTSQLTSRHLPS